MNFVLLLLSQRPDQYASEIPHAVESALADRYISPQIARDLIKPLYSGNPTVSEKIENQIATFENQGDLPPVPKRRTDINNISADVHQHPVYTIGSYFKHKRYGYNGIVIGWDSRCASSEMWMLHMQVDR